MRKTTFLTVPALSVLVACGGNETIQVGRTEGAPTTSATTPTGPTPTPATPTPAPPGAEVADAGTAPQPPSYRDEEFQESDQNRDPFRNFLSLWTQVPQAAVVEQREVIMRDITVEEMRLIAIISGVANPSAMLLDASGTGYSVRRGDYLGRAEIVQTGGPEGVPVSLNWRVDRIRADEVVLTREDPTAPNRPPLMRVMPLHPEALPQ